MGEQEIDDVETTWGHCLVGYFTGKIPGKIALLQMCYSWTVKYHYFVYNSSLLIFKFDDGAVEFKVLEGGPYFVFGRPLIENHAPMF